MCFPKNFLYSSLCPVKTLVVDILIGGEPLAPASPPAPVCSRIYGFCSIRKELLMPDAAFTLVFCKNLDCKSLHKCIYILLMK